MIAILKQIEQRPILRPQYARAETFARWKQINHSLLWNYWVQLERELGSDQDHPSIDFHDFARSQFDLETIR